MRLRKGNVERVTNDQMKIEKLMADGYEPMESKSEPKSNSESKDYGTMTVAELKAAAKEKGIEGYSSLTKDQLLDVLKGVV